jgi:hypothetical protein
MKTCQYTTLRDTYKVLTIDRLYSFPPDDLHVFYSGGDQYTAEGTTLFKWSKRTGLPRRVGRDFIIGGN